MKPTTRKVSGTAMERLFRQVLAGDGAADAATAERLARRLALVMTSVRARRVPLRELARAAVKDRPDLPAARPSAATRPTPQPAPPPAEPPAAAPAAAFDPFVFGLVPVYQREGRDGLTARLAAIAAPADLKAMAKAQNVALEARLRNEDVSAEDLRTAIVAAVEKRIADRRAAAS
ncbi:MAG: hypothetical protein ACOYLQ_19285 [Hyphomicrobiaceae bacterium]